MDAVKHAQRLVIDGHTAVVDADLSGYFDSIPHAELMRSVARRVSDRHLLALLKRWLEAPVSEADARGRLKRTTRNKDEGRGCPQGAPLSPLLANLYMRRFILGWKVLGHEQRLDAHIVNYADDFVICCRGSADEALAVMRDLMARLRLTVNETKTRLCHLPEETFNFLGYTVGRRYDRRTGWAYIGVRPSDKKVQAVCQALHDQTDRRWLWVDPEEMAGRLNAILLGWSNYFCLGTISAAYRRVQGSACTRLRRWLVRKHKVQGPGWTRFPNRYLHETLGLIRLQRRLPGSS